jgi:hypothetical protein
MLEFILDFCGEDSLTEIDIVSDITGLSIEELRTLDTYICVEDELPW